MGKSNNTFDFLYKTANRKNWDFGRDSLLVFINYEKVFDSINRTEIWECLNKLKITTELINRIKQIYEITMNCVKTNRGFAEWFKTKNRVWQDRTLSPLLFNVIMNDIHLKIKQETDDTKYKTWNFLGVDYLKYLHGQSAEWHCLYLSFRPS